MEEEGFKVAKRARRRGDLQRMKAKAHRIYPHWPNAHMHANHLAACSKCCCRNPRHAWNEITMAERRAYLDEHDQDE